MRNKAFPILLILFFLWPQMASASRICTLGIVPQFEARKIFAVWEPIANELTRRIGCTFKVETTESIPQFEKKFKNGDYDFAYMNPYHGLMAEKAQGYLPLVRSGTERLRGILVLNQDSTIRDVRGLDGKTIAFPSPNALGASLLMRAELKRNLNIDIKPIYVKTHSSVYLYVAKNLADAGGGIEQTLKEESENLRSKLKVFYRTAEFAPHPLMAHPRVDKILREKVRDEFLTLGQQHPDWVEAIPMPQPIAAQSEDYDPLRKMNLQEFEGKP